MDDFIEPVCPASDRIVTISHGWGTITLALEATEENYNLADVVGALVRPALLAAGYAESVVEKHVPEVYF